MQHQRISIKQAAEYLKDGKVLAYPTEAVYGLGCDPLNEQAVKRILALKSRDISAGLILISDRFERFESFHNAVTENQLELALNSWPGPVTWLFPRNESVPDYLAGHHSTIALRVTGHETSRSLCQAFGGAIVSTSANPHGAEPARSAQRVFEYFGNEIDGIVDGPLGKETRPSEIRHLSSGETIRKA